MLISEYYRGQNKLLHDAGNYGVTAPKWFKPIGEFLAGTRARSVLDYGSGTRRWLEREFGDAYDVRSYDPCVAGLDGEPAPADAVVSIDVLEHIEPAALADVLAHIASKIVRAGFLTIATGPAGKTLADGRNAHLIQEGPEWWLPKLWGAALRVSAMQDMGKEFLVVVTRK